MQAGLIGVNEPVWTLQRYNGRANHSIDEIIHFEIYFTTNRFLHFYETYFRCALDASRVSEFGGKRCSGLDRVPIADFAAELPKVAYWIEAIEAFTFAVDAANRQLCGSRQPFCQAFKVGCTVQPTQYISLHTNCWRAFETSSRLHLTL